ncbi:retrovirus-related Pol polyprotein from transposon 297 [Trichonephila clavipes]|nr:retrovirus-related Pol polyprotein from transposon 297 [Trichonephila clavipes]
MEPPRVNLTSDLPIYQRAYRTSATSEAEINKQIQNLLAAGLIKESNSCYSSPVTLAYKRDEKQKTRLCIDYRKLNAICKTHVEPLSRIDSLLDKLNSVEFFSKLDLASGYWHIPLHDKDKEKLAFVTTEGLYEFLKFFLLAFEMPQQFLIVLFVKF